MSLEKTKGSLLVMAARAGTNTPGSRAETESIVGLYDMQDLMLSNDLKPYLYADVLVSCPTFSAGIEALASRM